MGFFNFIDPVLNVIFGPVLRLPPTIALAILSLVIAFVIVIIYKYTTNQTLMKSLKERIKEAQKEMKKHSKDHKKLMEIQRRAMDANMQYMMHSMRSTLFTLIPVIIIFGWMSAHLGYASIEPNTAFNATIIFAESDVGPVELQVGEGLTLNSPALMNVTGNAAAFTLQGTEGTHLLTFKHAGAYYTKKVIIAEGYTYAAVQKGKETFRDKIYAMDGEHFIPQNSPVSMITLSNEKLITLNLFGWKLGWFGTYIIFSILFSILLRKALKVY